MTLFDLTNHVALLTGSSRGIGYAAAQALAQQGATVIINGRKADTVADAVARLQGQGLKALPLVFDIEDIDATLTAVDSVLERVERIDIFFANAAIQHREPLATFPLGEFERILFANLTSQWALGKHIASTMTPRQYGRIIFTGSATAILGKQDVTAYTAAKAALHGLVRQWAAELTPQGITVNAIAPGYIKTELTQNLWNDPNFNDWLTQHTPYGGWGDAQDIASAAVFLAARESRFVTGHILTVDGGLSSTMM